jgi:hypothetical protein
MNTGSYNSEGHLKIPKNTIEYPQGIIGNDHKANYCRPIQMTNNIYSIPSRKIDSVGKGIQSFIANKIRNIS